MEHFFERYLDPARDIAQQFWSIATPQIERIFVLAQAGSDAYPLQTIAVLSSALIAALFGRSLSVLLAGLCISATMLVALSPVADDALLEYISAFSVAAMVFILTANYRQWRRKNAHVQTICKMDKDHDATRAKLEGEKRWRLATKEFESKTDQASGERNSGLEGT